jgi:hypothetical protein
MKSRSFSESHSIPYNKFRALGFLEAPICMSLRSDRVLAGIEGATTL